ncbi:type II toxin-antitoxin system RelE/ParE family toxin [Jannaschia sp. Os4]|uniref:type II toxin-antitoxin system RelE/ParE family toxin n=1 Tax=Jannaschia sp. Os4 TaxID=2807617 RepID=UPI00193ADA6E|nr:type II toxin-antitoxin system RelE/ParE family toxin [Jannaschia sp. Os4]MBM2575373.1 type II toxin-antitoxin system RelE/ParE family toxin [Jannaschia sp. Os4]
MRIVRHPFVERDLIGIVDHIVNTTEGDYAAAYRRLNEVDALLVSVLASPTSGVRLLGELDSWLVRHGGTGQRLTVVFKPDLDNECIYLAMVAFGGRDWMKAAVGRRGFGD